MLFFILVFMWFCDVVRFVVVMVLHNFCWFSCYCCCSCYPLYVVVIVVGDVIVHIVVMFVNVVVNVVVNVFKVVVHVVVIVWLAGQIFCRLAGAHRQFFVEWPSSSVLLQGHLRCKKKPALDDVFCFNQTPLCFRSVWYFFLFTWSVQILSKTNLQIKMLYIILWTLEPLGSSARRKIGQFSNFLPISKSKRKNKRTTEIIASLFLPRLTPPDLHLSPLIIHISSPKKYNGISAWYFLCQVGLVMPVPRTCNIISDVVLGSATKNTDQTLWILFE